MHRHINTTETVERCNYLPNLQTIWKKKRRKLQASVPDINRLQDWIVQAYCIFETDILWNLGFCIWNDPIDLFTSFHHWLNQCMHCTYSTWDWRQEEYWTLNIGKLTPLANFTVGLYPLKCWCNQDITMQPGYSATRKNTHWNVYDTRKGVVFISCVRSGV